MTAAELRIGNYLNYLMVDGKYHPQKINSGSDIDGLNDFQPIPIPLTPEILEKCGFEYDSIEWPSAKVWVLKSVPLQDKYICALQQKTGPSFWYRPANLKVQYIHQLQNLFYSLTGEELSIDLNNVPSTNK
jgi:hypothetical protein